MLHLIFYFQVHQPYRLQPYRFIHIGKNHNYFDDELNRKIFEKVSDKCYIPANNLLWDLINQFAGRFKVSLSLTGTFVEQARQYRPDVLASFRRLAQQGGVEFLGETYYHSLACLFDENEFLEQVRMHSRLMEEEFGTRPVTFRNTELVYGDRISGLVSELPQFKLILTEGADKILNWRSPLYAYKSYSQRHLLLLKYYRLSDDIAFRFSDRAWTEYPLTAGKFVDWILKLPLVEKKKKNLYLNLFMDYETLGEHQWSETGIFEFIKHLPEYVLKRDFVSFSWPSEVMDSLNYEPEALSIPTPISWADTERDLSAWLSNSLQWNAVKTCYNILRRIKESERPDLLEVARKLSTSDISYYMCTKYFQDGDVHKYFSPYSSPEDIYIYYMNVLADVEKRLEDGI
ncbi:MAG: alpha-amylase [Planctomycetes bacterium DG_23]|nr:MAG: alpha-amylase [Planctomycetes bacterium DG_23]